MKRLLSVTPEQMAEIDHIAIHEYGLQPLQLTESAGRSLARLCRLMLEGSVAGKKIIVLSGGGRSAGGGLAAARNLHNWGASVNVSLAVPEDSLKRSAITQLNILESMGLMVASSSSLTLATLAKFDLIIDALLEHNSQGNPAGEFAHVITTANRASVPLISLDVPSGLDAESGNPYSPCVSASATLALTLPKTGLLEKKASEHTGELWLADIGIPPEVYRRLGLKGSNPFVGDDLVLLHRKEKSIVITA